MKFAAHRFVPRCWLRSLIDDIEKCRIIDERLVDDANIGRRDCLLSLHATCLRLDLTKKGVSSARLDLWRSREEVMLEGRCCPGGDLAQKECGTRHDDNWRDRIWVRLCQIVPVGGLGG
jgi:hypothetical protein